MFKHDTSISKETVTVTFDGNPVKVPAGVSVAAALLGKGEKHFRKSPSGDRTTSPHCLMGVCYECLMEIDGVNRQSCLVQVREGMVINRHLHNGGGEE